MGTLYIVATPIGNREDITVRALKTLFSVDVIACEDTRKTKALLEFYSTTPPFNQLIINNYKLKIGKLISYYKENEAKQSQYIINILQEGKSVALVSNAGTPLISDPGYVLVRDSRRLGIKVIPIPGASSLTTALSSSGVPTDKVLFLGFLPKSRGKRNKQLQEIAKLRNGEIVNTIVLFESANRVEKTISDIQSLLPHATITIARELTKQFEEIYTVKSLKSNRHAELISASNTLKGEVVLIIS